MFLQRKKRIGYPYYRRWLLNEDQDCTRGLGKDWFSKLKGCDYICFSITWPFIALVICAKHVYDSNSQISSSHKGQNREHNLGEVIISHLNLQEGCLDVAEERTPPPPGLYLLYRRGPGRQKNKWGNKFCVLIERNLYKCSAVEEFPRHQSKHAWPRFSLCVFLPPVPFHCSEHNIQYTWNRFGVGGISAAAVG